MIELTEMDVMRAMVRAKINRVGVYSIDIDQHVSGRCKHKVAEFSHSTDTVAWRPKGWAGCAKCILTCCDILEDPDMPTECEELALRAELSPAVAHRVLPRVAFAAAVTVSFTLGALLL